MKTANIYLLHSSLKSKANYLFLIFFIPLTAFIAVSTHANPLSGTRTIGGTNPDYTTFSLAVAALELNGVGQGGVTFLVAPGVYSEMFVIHPVAGAGPGSLVVFKAHGGAVTVNALGTPGNDVAIRLAGADHLIFDGINVSNGGTTSDNFCEVGYELATLGTDDGASYNIIRNCAINMAWGTVPPVLSRGIRTSLTSINSPTGASSYNIFRNIAIDGVETGIYLGGAYFMEATHNEISGCTFGANVPIGNDAAGSSGTGMAILISDQKNCRIHGNIIDSVRVTNSAATGSAMGIYIFRSVGDVSGNMVHHVFQGGVATPGMSAGIYASANFSGSLVIANNMIRGISSGYTGDPSNLVSVLGMGSFNSSSTIQAPVQWYYNTVELSANGNKMYSSAAFIINASNGNHQANVKNNIFVNRIPSANVTNWSFSIIDFNSSLLNLTSDYNNLYVSAPGGYVGYNQVNSAFSASLQNWQTNNPGKDVHSVSFSPLFVSSEDLHLDPDSNGILMNAAIPVAGVIADFDTTVRGLATPDIGADEICTTLAVIPQVTISSGIPPMINEGETIEFAATTTDAGISPNLQWLVNGVPAGSASATFSSGSFQNGDQVCCMLISSLPCGSALPVYSDTITITVYSVIPGNTVLEYFSTGWGYSECFHALDTIVTAGDWGYFEIYSEGSVELIAGERILLKPGTVVYSGAFLLARIAPSGPFCRGAISANPASPPDVVLSTSHRTEGLVRAWPNPTDGLFMVELKGDDFSGNTIITLTDLQGITLMERSLAGERSVMLSLALQPAGIYLLTIRNARKVQQLKVVRY